KIKDTLARISLEKEETNNYLETKNSAPLTQKQKAAQLLLRPGIDLLSMTQSLGVLKESFKDYNIETLEQAEIQIKYEVYIGKEKELAERMSKLENLLIPENFNYAKIHALSAEALQKFNKIKPRTLGQASRISGVSPSDVQILMVYMGR